MLSRVFHTVIMALCEVVNFPESWEVRKQSGLSAYYA